MSKRIKACFDTPTPSEALRQRVQTMASQSRNQQKQKGTPAPMPLKIYSSLIATIIIGGLCINHLHPPRSNKQLLVVDKSATAQDLPHSEAMTVGDRVLRIYSVHQNDKGEVMMIYTAGKKPEDALAIYGNVKVLDSSHYTPDWTLIAKNDRNEPWKAIYWLPFKGRYGIDRQIVPERIAPDGSKYESIAFKFSGKPSKKCHFTFKCEFKNVHSPELWDKEWQRRKGKPHPQAIIHFTKSLDRQKYSPSERVPAAWAKYGIDVATAITQLR
jgi:hypothetical protein